MTNNKFSDKKEVLVAKPRDKKMINALSSYDGFFLIFFYAYVSQFYDVFFFYRKALATI